MPKGAGAEVARLVFDRANGNGDAVVPVTTAEYYAGAEGPIAPRPANSTLDLAKVEAAGFAPADWRGSLDAYMDALL